MFIFVKLCLPYSLSAGTKWEWLTTNLDIYLSTGITQLVALFPHSIFICPCLVHRPFCSLSLVISLTFSPHDLLGLPLLAFSGGIKLNILLGVSYTAFSEYDHTISSRVSVTAVPLSCQLLVTFSSPHSFLFPILKPAVYFSDSSSAFNFFSYSEFRFQYFTYVTQHLLYYCLSRPQLGLICDMLVPPQRD